MTRRRVGLALVALAAAAALLPLGAYWAAWWWLQRSLVFPVPTWADAASLHAEAVRTGAEELSLVAEDGVRLYGWRRRGGAGDRLILFFSGNGEALSDYVAFHDLATANGFDLATVAYRGYPGSEPIPPSEAGLAKDARALWSWALAAGYDPARIVVHGRSLGGGVAAELVRGETPERAVRPAALVLESTFVRIPAVVGQWAPLLPHRLLTRDPFDTLGHADALRLPVLVLHCTGDTLIPPELGGRALAAALPDARYVEIAGLTHQHDLPVSAPEAGAAWVAFVEGSLR